MQELIAELERLVEIYDAMDNVQSGDEAVDKGFIQMRDIVVDDLRSLLSDLKEMPQDRPNIPVGFRLYAVRH